MAFSMRRQPDQVAEDDFAAEREALDGYDEDFGADGATCADGSAGDDEAVENDDAPVTFTANGKTYCVRITRARLNLYELRHKPVMATFIQNDGAFSAEQLTSLLAYGLCLEGGGFVNPKRGMVMAERIMEATGYTHVMLAVMQALERDCGFLFMGE